MGPQENLDLWPSLVFNMSGTLDFFPIAKGSRPLVTVLILTDSFIVEPQKIDLPTPRKVIRNSFGSWVLKATV